MLYAKKKGGTQAAVIQDFNYILPLQDLTFSPRYSTLNPLFLNSSFNNRDSTLNPLFMDSLFSPKDSALSPLLHSVKVKRQVTTHKISLATAKASVPEEYTTELLNNITNKNNFVSPYI